MQGITNATARAIAKAGVGFTAPRRPLRTR
jgi:hypothetical protein